MFHLQQGKGERGNRRKEKVLNLRFPHSSTFPCGRRGKLVCSLPCYDFGGWYPSLPEQASLTTLFRESRLCIEESSENYTHRNIVLFHRYAFFGVNIARYKKSNY